MSQTSIEFIQKNKTVLIELQHELNLFKKDSRNKLDSLKSQLEELKNHNVEFGYFSQSSELKDILFCNVKISPKRTVAIDITLDPEGWSLGVFERQNRAEDTKKLAPLFKTGTLTQNTSNTPIINIAKVKGYTNPKAEEILINAFQDVIEQL